MIIELSKDIPGLAIFSKLDEHLKILSKSQLFEKDFCGRRCQCI